MIRFTVFGDKNIHLALAARREKIKTQLWYTTVFVLHWTPFDEEIAGTLIVGEQLFTYKTIFKKERFHLNDSDIAVN